MAARNLKLEDSQSCVYRGVSKTRTSSQSYMFVFACKCKLPDPEHIDQVISAEIPDEFGNPELYELLWIKRTPLFERLPFHLPGDQSVYFDEGSCIEDIVNNPSVNETIKKGFSLGRVHYVSPSACDAYFFKTLLNKQKGPMSWEEIHTVDGELFKTKKMLAMPGNVHGRCWPRIWSQFKEEHLIGQILQRNGTSLKQIPNMTYPDLFIESHSINKLVEDKLSYSVPKLNVDHSKMLTCKTFVWKTLSAVIRRRRDIVLNVASSGI
ncbi:hypothetical protein Tco_0407059 [Tanacetum coccineum]